MGRTSRRPSRCSGGSSSSLSGVSGMSAVNISSSVSMCNEQWSSGIASSDSSCCTAPAAYFQTSASSSSSSSSSPVHGRSSSRGHMRSASSSQSLHSLSAILNDYTNDKLSLDAQLDAIVPQHDLDDEIYGKTKKGRNSKRNKSQQFYNALRADAIVSSIKKFSEASRQHLPEECHRKAVSACERSTSLCQDITNCISPSSSFSSSSSTNDTESISSRRCKDKSQRSAGHLHPANPGLLLFVAAMCCVVLYGNLNSSPSPLSDSDARYERMLATRGSSLRSSAHRSLQMDAPAANAAAANAHGHGNGNGPTDINALLESQSRAQAEMHHSAAVLAASNAAAAFPTASDQRPSRHQPLHHSAHHQGQYAQQPYAQGGQNPAVLISEPAYYPDTDYSGATAAQSWMGAGWWLSLIISVVGILAAAPP